MELINFIQKFNEYLISNENEAMQIFDNIDNYVTDEYGDLLNIFYNQHKNNLYKKETYQNIKIILNNLYNRRNYFSIIYLYQCLYTVTDDKYIFYAVLENITDDDINDNYDWLDEEIGKFYKCSDDELKILFQYCNKIGLYEIFYSNFSERLKNYISNSFKIIDINKQLQQKIETLEAKIIEMDKIIADLTYAPNGPGYELAKKDFQKHLENFK